MIKNNGRCPYFLLKQDKADEIKAKIIESTIGAILRSNAIQGKTT
jgi:hypothetical protein